MDQILQLAGALLILAPFMAAQFGRLRVTSVTYLVLNLAASAILTGVALVAEDWGLIRRNAGARASAFLCRLLRRLGAPYARTFTVLPKFVSSGC